MPYLIKGQNRYDLNATDKADLGIIAEEYDDTATYSDGDYVIKEGKLYKVDTVEGNYLEVGDNLYDPTEESETYVIDNKYARYLSPYQYTTDNTNYKIVRVNNLQIEKKYRLYARYEPSVDSTMCGVGFQTNGQTTNSPYPVYNSNGYADFQLTASGYFGISIHKGYESEYSLYLLTSYKLKEVELADELSKKLDTSTAASTYLVNDMDTFPIAGSLKPVTSNGIKTALDAKANFVDTQEIISRYAIGNQYSSSTTYNDGDYLAVQRELYRVDSTGGIIPFGDSIFNKENTSTANGYKNGYCLFTGGSESASGSERITEYMPVLPNTTYVIKWTVGNWQMWNNRYWTFYNSNKQYVTEMSMCDSNPIFPNNAREAPQTVVFTTPNNPNIAYMRATVHNNVWNYLSIQPGSANNLKGVKIVAMDETKRLLATKADISSIPDVSTKADLSLIAQTYDATSGTYEVGDLVVYNGGLYKCTTDILSPEAWDSTHWTTTTLAEILKQIQTSLGGLSFHNGAATGTPDANTVYFIS